MAWREDMRRKPPSIQVCKLLELHNLYESKKWFGYWQRRRTLVDEDGVSDMDAREMRADGDHRDTG
jgi:hypothetical protein